MTDTTDDFNAAASTALTEGAEALRSHYERTQRARQATDFLEAVADWANHYDLDLTKAHINPSTYIHTDGPHHVVEFPCWSYLPKDFNQVRGALIGGEYTWTPPQAYPQWVGSAAGVARNGLVVEFKVTWPGVVDGDGVPAGFADGTRVPQLPKSEPS